MVASLILDRDDTANTYRVPPADATRSEWAALRDYVSPTIDLRDFAGSTGDGLTDNTQAFKDVVAEIGVGVTELTEGQINIPAGRYILSDEILLEGTRTTFQGHGSTIEWAGAANKPMFRTIYSQSCGWNRFRLLGSKTAMPGDTADPGPPLAAIQLEAPAQAPAELGVNSGHKILDCQIGTLNGQAAADLYPVQNGILIDGAFGGNNDTFTIGRCYIQGATDGGIKVVNAQSIWSRVHDTLVSGCNYGIYAGSNLQGTNVLFNRNQTDVHAIRELDLLFNGFYSENAVKVIQMLGGGSLGIFGGKIVITDNGVTPGDRWMRIEPGKRLTLMHLDVSNLSVVTSKLRFYPVVGTEGRIHIVNCNLPDYSATMSDWGDIVENAGTGAQITVDGTDFSI